MTFLRFCLYAFRLQLAFALVLCLLFPLAGFAQEAAEVVAEGPSFVSLLMANWPELLLALLGLLTVVFRLTPTEADDRALGTVLKFVHQFVPGGVTAGRKKSGV